MLLIFTSFNKYYLLSCTIYTMKLVIHVLWFHELTVTEFVYNIVNETDFCEQFYSFLILFVVKKYAQHHKSKINSAKKSWKWTEIWKLCSFICLFGSFLWFQTRCLTKRSFTINDWLMLILGLVSHIFICLLYVHGINVWSQSEEWKGWQRCFPFGKKNVITLQKVEPSKQAISRCDDDSFTFRFSKAKKFSFQQQRTNS